MLTETIRRVKIMDLPVPSLTHLLHQFTGQIYNLDIAIFDPILLSFISSKV